MINAVIVMNTQGKPRLTKFYEFQVFFYFSLNQNIQLNNFKFLISLSDQFEFDCVIDQVSRKAAGIDSHCLLRFFFIFIYCF